MSTLEGKVALVTGASSGIGRESALALARAGAAVVIGNRREDAGAETARLITEAGGRAVFQRTDVASQADIDALVQRAQDEFGALDVAFNNAGVEGAPGPLLEDTEENYDHIFNINVKGVWRSMRAEARVMAERGGGVIINNSSGAARKGFPGLVTYSASKGAVDTITRAAAVELGPVNVRVNAVAPGPIETDMMHRVTGGDTSVFDSLIPLGRVGVTEEIAGLVVFLASDAAAYITGQSYAVDGGITA